MHPCIGVVQMYNINREYEYKDVDPAFMLVGLISQYIVLFTFILLY